MSVSDARFYADPLGDPDGLDFPYRQNLVRSAKGDGPGPGEGRGEIAVSGQSQGARQLQEQSRDSCPETAGTPWPAPG